MVFASVALLAPAAIGQTASPDPVALFAREKLAVGGGAWASIEGLQSSGTLILGGAPSTFSQVVDHRTGFSKAITQIGSVTDVSGYDGVNWDFEGGPVTEQTLPGLQADNATQAYVSRDGWWHPDTDPATMTPLDSENGQDGVRVTPAGGSPIDVWFDRATGLIDRTVALTDYGRVETWIDDYRTVGDVVVAFHSVSRDPAGAVTTVFTELLTPLHAVSHVALARPKPISSGRIASGTVGIAPFKLSAKPGEIWVNVGFGKGGLRLMFDSGAGNYIIPAGAKRLAMTSGGGLPLEGFGTGSVNAGFATVGTITLGTAQLVKQHVVVAPLPYVFVHQGIVGGIDGLVGSEFLQSFRTTFDFDKQTITFEPFGVPAGPTPPGAVVLPILSDGAHALVRAAVNGVSGIFLLDTGDGGDITVFRPFADAHGLFSGPGLPYLSAGGVGGHLGEQRYRADSFTLGGGTMHQPPVSVPEATAGASASRSVAGNIGLRVLSRYRLTFDFRRGTVTFVPRAGIDAPFTPDRTGMSLTQDDPSAFIVLSVVPGSPSAQAGVRGGDHIVAVDGRSVPGAGLGLLDLRKYALGTKPFALTIKSADGTQHVVTIHPRALVPPLY